MPCHTPLGDHNEQLALQLKHHIAETMGKQRDERYYRQLDYDSWGMSTKDIDADTRALCEWCKANPTRMELMSPKFQEWWRNHQEFDRQRGGD